MLKVGIIGGGYFGMAAALRFSILGHEVVVIDDGDKSSGTRASAHLWRSEWFETNLWANTVPTWWNSLHLNASRMFLREIDREEIALMGDCPRGRNNAPWPVIDLYDFDSWAKNLYKVDRINGNVEVLHKHGEKWGVVYDGGKVVEVDRVVIAAGYRNWALCDSLGLGLFRGSTIPEIIRGRAWIFDTYNGSDAVRKADTISLHAVRIYPNLIRVGDSYEDKADQSGVKAQAAALTLVHEYYSSNIKAHVSEVSGYRERGIGGRAYVVEPQPGVLVMGGADRMGLGLAGGMAVEVAERIGRAE